MLNMSSYMGKDEGEELKMTKGVADLLHVYELPSVDNIIERADKLLAITKDNIGDDMKVLLGGYPIISHRLYMLIKDFNPDIKCYYRHTSKVKTPKDNGRGNIVKTIIEGYVEII